MKFRHYSQQGIIEEIVHHRFPLYEIPESTTAPSINIDISTV